MAEPNPTIAVIDPVAAAGPYGREGAELGLQVIGVLTQEFQNPYITQTYDELSFSEIWRHASIEETVSFLRSRRVVGVIPGAPSSLKFVDAIADGLGLPGNPIESAAARMNKRAMKQHWERHELPCAASLEASDANSIASWADSRGYPVVLKPTEGVGGVHVFVCTNRDELVEAFEVIVGYPDSFSQRSETALAEEYLDGDEYFMDLMHVGDGNAVPIAFARYEKVQRDGHASIYRNITSLPLDDDVALASVQYIKDINNALGVRYGVNDTEFKMTAKGPRVVEVNNRLPGASIPLMVQKCSGLNMFQENIRIFLGEDRTSAARPFTRHFNICCLINNRAGNVQGFNGLDEVRVLPSYDGERLIAETGAHWPVTKDLDGCWGLIRLVNEDRDQLERDTEAVHTTMQLIVG